MNAHSPLPWSYEEREGALLDAHNAYVLTTDGDLPTSPDLPDAAFIVKAVNCHHELLSALTDLLNAADAIETRTFAFDAAAGKAYRVIAKALGKG